MTRSDHDHRRLAHHAATGGHHLHHDRYHAVRRVGRRQWSRLRRGVVRLGRTPVVRRLFWGAMVAFAFVVVVMVALWWRLSSGPIELDAATPWLKSAIEKNFGDKQTVTVGGTQIERDENGRTSLRLRDIVVRDSDGTVVASAPKAEVGISGLGLLSGKVQAESLNLVGAEMSVRISPFDSNARRHTSFASVGVFPVIDDRIKIDIKESDVRTDVMRSGGAGGQHVNKTESAVRLTHIPTNIVVKCQQDRSQHRNRAMAWDMLRAKLFEMEIKKREAKAEVEQAAKTDIGWGHQIRSYVLQPYQMVKDLRTGVSTSNTGAVLDGDLDEFMQAALAQKAFGNGPGQVEDAE